MRRRRNNELLAIQGAISDQLSREQVGKTLDVFVEGLSRKEQKRRGGGSTCGSGTVALTIGGRADHGGSACAIDIESEPEPRESSVQLSGRTDGDLIVFFDAPAITDFVGRIVPIRIDRADRLSLHGVPV